MHHSHDERRMESRNRAALCYTQLASAEDPWLSNRREGSRRGRGSRDHVTSRAVRRTIPGMGSHASEITALLGRLGDGAGDAREALLSLVYRELEAIARGYLRRGAASIEPGELVHELYLKLAGAHLAARDRKHFYAIAALAMRQILTDRMRRRRAARRGGGAVQVTLSGLAAAGPTRDIADIEAALARLEAISPRQARVVELRCLIGMSTAETAEALDVSTRTVESDWRVARAWLTRELGGAPAQPQR
jgi:RNA polymerase sigma factor (TIGR02999 family)